MNLTMLEQFGQVGSNFHASRTLVEAMLDRIDSDSDRGSLCFLGIDREAARRDADAIDQRRQLGPSGLSSLAGLPVSVKDLFDVKGEVTRAGSKLLSRRPPAVNDAGVLVRLRQAGMVLLGRTNMTEFAYSGLGLNPHFGTPGNAHDSDHIPGGSSSGSGVAVACGFSAASIGTDTSGSVRIPAALNGVVGFKSSRGRYPSDGMIPLSPTQDTVGIITPSVRLCAAVDSALATDATGLPHDRSAAPVRLAIPRGFLIEDLDGPTGLAFERTLRQLSSAGFDLVDLDVPEIDEIRGIGLGGILGPEAYAWHKPLLAQFADEYDPRVRARIESAKSRLAADYLECLAVRSEAMAQIDRSLQDWDALLCPTTPIIAPRFDAIIDDNAYFKFNSRILRNTFAFNILDLPAISLPCQEPGAFPVGLMLVGKRHADRALLAIAALIENAIQGPRLRA